MHYPAGHGVSHRPHERGVHDADPDGRRGAGRDVDGIAVLRADGGASGGQRLDGLCEEPSPGHVFSDSAIFLRGCGPLLHVLAGNTDDHGRHERAERVSDDHPHRGTDAAHDRLFGHHGVAHQQPHVADLSRDSSGDGSLAVRNRGRGSSDFRAHFQEIRRHEQFRSGECQRNPGRQILRPRGL